jgi:hypothetical protein
VDASRACCSGRHCVRGGTVPRPALQRYLLARRSSSGTRARLVPESCWVLPATPGRRTGRLGLFLPTPCRTADFNLSTWVDEVEGQRRWAVDTCGVPAE